MKENTILLGVKKFTSKEGKDYAILNVSMPFTQSETNSGSIGMNTDQKFVPSELLPKVNDLEVNKPIHFDYNVIGKNAYVADFYTVK